MTKFLKLIFDRLLNAIITKLIPSRNFVLGVDVLNNISNCRLAKTFFLLSQSALKNNFVIIRIVC